MQAHLKTAPANALPKFFKELAKPTHRERLFKKICRHLKKLKNANTQANTDKQENEMTMTEKLNIDNGLQDWKTEHQAVTKCSSNKGFSGNWNILSRSNFGVFGQESSTQSLTAATLNRWR